MGLCVKRSKGSLFVCAAGKMAPPKGAEGEQKGGKSKGLKKPGRPPKAEKKPVVEGSSKGPGKKGKKAKRSIETYKIYIYKVLKQVALYFPLSFVFFPGLSVFDFVVLSSRILFTLPFMICLLVGLANLDVTHNMERMRKRPTSFIIDITANYTECTTTFLGARNTQLLRGCVFQVLL